MRAHVARAVGSSLLLLALLPQGASGLCRLETPATPRPSDAPSWLARTDAELLADLERERVVFPRPGSLEPCPDLIPALAVFAHPPEVVFRLLVQTDRHAEALPQLAGLRAMSRAPAPHVDRHEIAILFTRISYHVEQEWSQHERRIWWRLSPDHENDIRTLEGFWELHPYEGGRTLGVYGSRVDVGSAVPKRMQAALTRKNMRSAIHALREWVDREGRALAIRAETTKEVDR